MELESEIRDLVKKYALGVAGFRNQQLIDCIVQAVRSGDFALYIRQGDEASAAVYLPGNGQEELKRRIQFLEGLLDNEGIDHEEDN